MRNLRLKHSRLQDLQNKMLRAVTRHAYENVPFYRRKFDSAGLKPNDIKSTDDLSKLPMTTKDEIQTTPLSEIVARNIDVNKCVKGMTSGSTGLPLTVIIDRKADDFRRALWGRAFLENGWKPWDKMAIIKIPERFEGRKRWVERHGLLKRQEVSAFENVPQQARIIESYKPDLLQGYSSSLAILANFCNDRKSGINPRLVFTGAELLYKSDRELISSSFGCDVLDHYGSTEFSLLAWECPNHLGYHMNIDSTAIEFVRNGEVVAPGERGEIVCTSLLNFAMPLIRYRIGDIGVMIEEPCSCGSPLPLLEMLEGRADDFLTALDGRIISPIIFVPYPFRSLEGIKQFKVLQEKRDKLVIEIVTEENVMIGDRILENAKKALERVFGKGIVVDFLISDRIDKSANGKLRQVVSRIPVPWR